MVFPSMQIRSILNQDTTLRVSSCRAEFELQTGRLRSIIRLALSDKCTLWHLFQPLVHVTGSCYWFILLVHVTGSCYWLMLLVHVTGSSYWLMLLAHVWLTQKYRLATYSPAKRYLVKYWHRFNFLINGYQNTLPSE